MREVITEAAVWKQHRDLITESVKYGPASFRGCLGIALMLPTQGEPWITSGDHVFLRDRDVRWASLVDVPGEHVKDGRREIHWASVGPTHIVFGMPRIGHPVKNAWDFRAAPRKAAGRRYEGTTLDPAVFHQEHCVFNQLNWGMSSYAFNNRRSWAPGRSKFLRMLGTDHDCPVYLFGEERFDRLEPTVAWMPRAYLGFSEQLEDALWERSTRVGLNPQKVYPVGLRYVFGLAAISGLEYHAPFKGHVRRITRETYHGLPVIRFELAGNAGQYEIVRFSHAARVCKPETVPFEAGDVIAHEYIRLPTSARRNDPLRCWDWLWERSHGQLDAQVRIWFERQIVHIEPGISHISSELSSCAALGSALDSALMWEVPVASRPYLSARCNAFVFPSVPIPRWDALTGVLPGEIVYDFMPRGERISPRKKKR